LSDGGNQRLGLRGDNVALEIQDYAGEPPPYLFTQKRIDMSYTPHIPTCRIGQTIFAAEH